MANYSRNIIGRNVKAVRSILGLSQLKFAELVGLSKPTIINIESAKKGYNLNLLEKIINFSDYSLSDLSNKEFMPDPYLRDILTEKYSKHPEYYGILTKKPEIVYAIKFNLLKSDFLKTPREINEIRNYFKELGWNYLGTSISNALKRMPEKVLISKHESKRNTNVYLKTEL
jgi:transcriptional regulator with XRE-family HTH domain